MRTDCLRCSVVAAVFGCLALGPAVAAEKSFELTVRAGKHDRVNTPVSVLVELPAGPNGYPAGAKVATLADPSGKRVVGQLTAPGLAATPVGSAKQGGSARQLHFILPALKKGETLKLTATFTPVASAKGFAWKDTPGEHAELSCDGRPVLRYMYQAFDPAKKEQTYKVYHHVYDPTGKFFVTKGPGGLYTHHRGLFFGYCAVSFEGGRADTWGCGSGNQLHEKFIAAEGGPVLGRHAVAIAWRANPDRKFLTESRELTAYHVPGGNLIDFVSVLSTTGGKVKLDGNAPHAGFQFRAAAEVAEKTSKQTCFVRPDGKGEPGQARASAFDLAWDVMSFVLGEKRYTVLYLDKPTNPKPAEYNERTYGRFGSYFKHELDEGKNLLVGYRIWVQEGEITAEQAAALSADFVEPVELSVTKSW